MRICCLLGEAVRVIHMFAEYEKSSNNTAAGIRKAMVVMNNAVVELAEIVASTLPSMMHIGRDEQDMLS